jgi:hypothetical protein
VVGPERQLNQLVERRPERSSQPRDAVVDQLGDHAPAPLLCGASQFPQLVIGTPRLL